MAAYLENKRKCYVGEMCTPDIVFHTITTPMQGYSSDVSKLHYASTHIIKTYTYKNYFSKTQKKLQVSVCASIKGHYADWNGDVNQTD